MPRWIVAKGSSLVPSPAASSPCSLETKTPNSLLVQHAASSDTSPVQALLPPPPSPPAPLMPLVPLLEEPAVLFAPPLLPPASFPPPPDLPALPACDVPAALPQVANATQSSDELLQAESCIPAKPNPKASIEKEKMRMLVTPSLKSSPTS